MAASSTLSAKLTKKWGHYRAYVDAFGVVQATIILLADLSSILQQRLGVSLPRIPVPIRAGLTHPFRVRLFTSDMWVFKQILLEEQYADALPTKSDAFVIDLGGNIGAYAALVLSRRPDARVVCVEPDPNNAAIARRNLAPYGSRAEVLATAIWNEPVPLRIESEGVGKEWAVRVRPCRDGERPDVTAVTIGEILEREGRDRIDVLKVDIEGAEEQLFAGTPSWIDAVELYAIELHGPDATRTVEEALGSEGWSRQWRGEVNLFRRRTA